MSEEQLGRMIDLVDIHRHLSGSFRPETVWTLLKDEGIFKNVNHVFDNITYRNDVGMRSFYKFLSKFEVLNKIQWSKTALSNIVKSVVKDVRREGVHHAELRFSIDKYLQYINSPEEIIRIIYNTVKVIADHNGIVIKLLLCLKYESDRDHQLNIAKLINSDVANMIDGIDCVGDEHMFSAKFYKPIYKEWCAAGKMLTAHAGELGHSAENIKLAIEELGVKRIGHGITIVNNKDVMKLAKERDICFEISLSSNWYTGVVENMSKHPIRKMADYGLNIALCTDDPATFGTTMNQEFSIARMCLGFTDAEIQNFKQNALKYAIKPRSSF